jgi:energy-converting hydrogenase Eha subunit C
MTNSVRVKVVRSARLWQVRLTRPELIMRLTPLLAIIPMAFAASGCVVATVAGAAVDVAATTVTTAAHVTGAVVRGTADVIAPSAADDKDKKKADDEKKDDDGK